MIHNLQYIDTNNLSGQSAWDLLDGLKIEGKSSGAGFSVTISTTLTGNDRPTFVYILKSQLIAGSHTKHYIIYADYNSNNNSPTIAVAAGDAIYIESYNDLPLCVADNNDVYYTTITPSVSGVQTCKISGDIRSLLNKDWESITTLPEYAFYRVFSNITTTSIDISDLRFNATVLGSYCYYGLFRNSVISDEELQYLNFDNVTNFGESSCEEMFYNSSLTTINITPLFNNTNAIVYSKNCLKKAFYNCMLVGGNITLKPINTYNEGCFTNAFTGTKVLYVYATDFTTSNISNLTPNNFKDWLSPWIGIDRTDMQKVIFFDASVKDLVSDFYGNVIPNQWLVLFKKTVNNTDHYVRFNGTDEYEYVPGLYDATTAYPEFWDYDELNGTLPQELEYLSLTNTNQTSISINIKRAGNTTAPWDESRYVYYSYDKIIWNELPTLIDPTLNSTISVNAGRTIYIKSISDKFSVNNDKCLKFNVTSNSIQAEFECHGNIMSLAGHVDKRKITDEYMFVHLFDQTAITLSPILPATVLSKECYSFMFYGCTHLTSMPVLPASQLVTKCYNSMFTNCTNLIITDNDNLPANDIPIEAYYNMFNGCSSTTKTPTFGTGNNHILSVHGKTCNLMFKDCTALTEIKSVTIRIVNTPNQERDFANMFENCTSLVNAGTMTIKCSTFTDIHAYEFFEMFKGCTSLVTPPVFDYSGCNYNNITLMPYSFSGMFEGCSALTSIYNLPFIHIANSCYKNMYKGCSSITNSPQTLSILPATITSNENQSNIGDISCYESMFENCIALLLAPQLPSISLATACYKNMFKGCIALGSTLTAQPDNDNRISQESINSPNGWNGINSIKPAVVALESVDLAPNCYEGMFEGCISIEQSPQLQAPNIDSGSYNNMFKGCTSIKKIECLAEKGIGTNTVDWVDGVPQAGIFIKSVDSGILWPGPILGITNGIPYNWMVEEVVNEANNYLQFLPKSGNIRVFAKHENGFSANIWYSFDKENWQLFTSNPISVDVNRTLYVCGQYNERPTDSKYLRFEITGVSGNNTESCILKGNLMSLLFCTSNDKNSFRFRTNGKTTSNVFVADFRHLFENTIIEDVPEISLFEDNIPIYCEAMFANCKKLANVAYHTRKDMSFKLSNFKVTAKCYKDMFKECSSLVYVPENLLCYKNTSNVWTKPNKETDITSAYENMFYNALKNVLSNILYIPLYSSDKAAVYKNMFYNCTGITSDKIVWVDPTNDPLTVIGNSYFESMFEGCNSMTNMTTNMNSVFTNITMKSACYKKMFKGTNITSTCNFPATTLAANCYESMFEDCKHLTSVRSLVATVMATECYKNMFKGCQQLQTIPALPALTLAVSCYQSMFENCVSIVNGTKTGPNDVSSTYTLPATTLQQSCYERMFSGCSNLLVSPNLPATVTNVSRCYYEMFENCRSLNQIQCLSENVTTAELNMWHWVNNVSENGTFVISENIGIRKYTTEQKDWEFGINGIPLGWNVYIINGNPYDAGEQAKCLYFTALEDNCYIGIYKEGSIVDREFVINYGNSDVWYPLTLNTLYKVNKDDVVYIKSDDNVNYCATSPEQYYHFKTTGKFQCGGNVMALIMPKNYNDRLENLLSFNDVPYVFTKLFAETNITTSPVLPVKQLTPSCYYAMFYKCKYLTVMPVIYLEANNEYSCQYMFNNCISLQRISIAWETSIDNPRRLPLSKYAFYGMFNGCLQLGSIPETLITNVDLNNHEYVFCEMFYNCKNIPEHNKEDILTNIQEKIEATLDVAEQYHFYDKLFNDNTITEELKSLSSI